jgi:chromosome segregation ATPase
MNLDDLVKKIVALEDENRSNAKTMAALNSKIKKIEDSNSTFLDTARLMKKEVERLNSTVSQSQSSLSRLGQFDISLAQIRVEISKKMNELENKQKQFKTTFDNIRKEDQNSINKLITSNRKELTSVLEKRMKTFFEEDSRLVKKIEEMATNFDDNLKKDQLLQQMVAVGVEESQRNAKKIENIQMEIEPIRKKVDDYLNKSNMIMDNLRKNDTRLSELVATESQRKVDQSAFLEQQTVLQIDHDRTWKEWMRQFEETSQKTNTLLRDLPTQYQELKRSKESFIEITQRFDRRVNELTEMYRILEERLRQDWATFKGDEQKRWSNYSLIFGEKQGDFLHQYEGMKSRITSLEDQTKEFQEVLAMVSTELQKGMQGLMKMVNNWIETFDDFHSVSKPKKEA